MEELYQKLIDDGILRKHNLRAYMKVAQMFETKNKVAIDHATGTGKSFISLQLMYDNQDKNIIFLVPREGIGTQIEEHINGLSPDAREKHFKNVKIMTTQSFIRLTREELKNLDVDLLITDEFHHYGSEVWGTKVKHLINTHPNLKVFGMTATPKRERGSSREEDMGETFFEGNIASRYSLADAIEEGVLQAPIYRGAIYKLDDQIEESIDKVEHSNLDIEEKRELLEKLKLAKKRVQEADSFNEIVKKNIKKGGKYIVFCPQKNEDMESVIESSYSWFKNFIDESEITRYQVRSKNSKRINKINSDAFYNDKEEGKLKLMFAMDMYNEGIHVPDIDGVIMLRPTQSDIIFYQQLGRALAAGGSNKRPLVLDFVNNYDYIRKLELKVKQKRESKERERKHSEGYVEEYNLDIVFDIDVENIDIQNLLFEINNKIELTYEDKIADFIEKLNQGYVPKNIDIEKKFSNGESINQFWSTNKDKIKELLFTDTRYAIGYETAKDTINNLGLDKIADFIEKLNQGYIPKRIDEESKFSNGEPINYFWNNHKDKIKELLFTDTRYAIGYEKAKDTINNLGLDKIADFIEKLNQGYIPKKIDEESKFSNGEPINAFWAYNKDKIKELLFTDTRYVIGYETAKDTINNLGFDKIADFIEKLNLGYIPKALDEESKFSNGKPINAFWAYSKDKIKELLFTDTRYAIGYETAKDTINNLGFDKIADFIEKLNQGYIPKKIDKESKFSNGDAINYFWQTNKEKIKERLLTDTKYTIGYETAKETINNLNFDKIADFIEILNQGYIPKQNDKESKFSNGEPINAFWNNHKGKIKERLFTDSRYAIGYEIAKKTIIDKLGLNEEDIELNNGGKKL